MLAAALAGCASSPKTPGSPPGGWPDKDGPDPNPPPGLMDVPDAEPRVEMIRTGGPNKPYEIFGRAYVPVTTDQPFVQSGLASWYGRKFHGRPTASGELYNMYSMTAAHPTLPIPSFARIRNPANGKEVIVRVNDRGPFHSQRAIDLSYTAALKLGVLRGVSPVQIERLTHDEIRAGSWRRTPPQPGDTMLAAVAAPVPATATPAPVAVANPPAAADASAAAAPAPMAAAAPVQVLAQTGAAAPAQKPAQAPLQAPAPADPTPVPLPQETARAVVPGAVGFWVQLGAFKAHDSAVSLQRRVMAELDALAPLLAIFNEGSVHRLQAGPYATRDDAAQVAQRVRGALQMSPIIVQRR